MERYEIIDALVDGERVDAAALKRALAEEAARDYLVDVWLLREELQDEMTTESAPADVPARRRSLPWPVAAAVAIVTLGAGYVAGYRLADPAPREETVAVAPASSPDTLQVPAPTRVIRLAFPGEAEGRGGN